MEEVDIGKDFNRKTILVVDDEESIVDLLVYHLQKEGYIVDGICGSEVIDLDKTKNIKIWKFFH